MPVLLTLLCTLLVYTPLVSYAASTYYIAASGASNSNNGLSPSTPWATFAFALGQMSCGDTLILRDGVYDQTNSGFIVINSRNCSAVAPLTIKAEHEHQAWIHEPGTGYGIRTMFGSYLIFEGLRVSSTNLCYGGCNVPAHVGSSDGGPIWATDPDHFTFRKLLLHNPNNFCNCHALDIHRGTNTLIEDVEIYNFHRHGVDVGIGTNNTIRRLYCNSRFALFPPDIADNGRGDSCVALYPGSTNLVENVISENNDRVIEMNSPGPPSEDNRVYNAIAYNNSQGIARTDARGFDSSTTSHRNLIRDSVAYWPPGNPGSFGINNDAGSGTRCDSCTVLNSSGSGVRSWTSGGYGDGTVSVYGTNILVQGAGGYAFDLGDSADYGFDYTNVYSSFGGFSPNNPSKQTHQFTLDPQLGTCIAWIPDASPVRHNGLGGNPIGAMVLYQYINGTLSTTTPMWDTTTGAFAGCGVIVNGVNDTGQANGSCANVQQRLNVNTNGCAFPAGYGSPLTATTTPIFVSPGGHGDTPSDSNSCSQAETITTPKATIPNALGCMTVAKKKLYVRGGTYSAVIDTAVTPITGGDSTGYTTIEGYQTEVATLELPSSNQVGVWLRAASDSYIELKNLTIDAMNLSNSNAIALYSVANHLKLTNVTAKNSFFEPLFITGADFIEVRNSTFITSTMNGVGVGGTVTDLLFTGNTIRNHTGAGMVLNVGDGSYANTTIMGNTLYSTGTDGTSPAMYIGTGTGVLIANNLLHNSRAGLRLGTGAASPKVYNNTITMNTTYGIQCDAGVTGAQFTNNIVYNNGTAFTNNCGAVLTTNLTTNPVFALESGVNSDFHLTPSSTSAIAQGTNLSSIFTTDFDGQLRPASGAGNWDIGAYQFNAGVPNVASQVEFGVQPSTTSVSNMITPAPTVQIQRSDGAVVTSSTAQVTLAIVSTQIPTANLTLVGVDSAEPGHAGTAALDGVANTYWQSQVTGGVTSHPHNMIVSFPSTSVNGLRYTTRADAASGGIAGYEAYVSTDCSTWGVAVATGAFNTIGLGKAYGITFPPKTGSCLRLVTTSGVAGTATSSIAELSILQLSTTLLNGTKVVDAVVGAATFPTLSVSSVLSNVVLQATSPGLISQLSQPFDVTTGAIAGVQPPALLRFIPPK